MTANIGNSRHYRLWAFILCVYCAGANISIAASSDASSDASIELRDEQADYQHANTQLVFSLYDENQQPSANDQQRVSEIQAWRHRYEIVLTQQGDSRVLFDQYGVRHVFHPRSEGGFSAQSSGSGELQQDVNGYRWINATGIIHRFHGSYLTQIIFPESTSESTIITGVGAGAGAGAGAENFTTSTTTPPHNNTHTLNLQYDNNHLSSVTDQLGNQIQFNNSTPGLVSVTTPDGNTFTYADRHCATVEHSEPARCDTAANPLPESIFSQIDRLQSQIQTNITHLDARPASCNSYFTDFMGTERGSQIESGVGSLMPYSTMQPTVRSFPIVDFINGSELIAIRSRDLSSPSFNNPEHASALLDRLLRDGSEIRSRLLDPLDAEGSISHTEQGETTTISNQPNQTVVLQLLIQQQIASPSHWQQIELAQIQLMARYGIQLEVVLIP